MPIRFDEVIRQVAAGQHGVVSRRQLLAAGVSRHAIDRRIPAGLLRPIHRGVYTVGPVTPEHAPEMAAVLAHGPRAVVSHWSAGYLWRIPQRVARPPEVHVSVAGGGRGHEGVSLHRVRSLGSDEVTRREGIPVTTPARTLLDLAGSATPRVLEQALAEALARRLTTLSALEALLARHRRRRGTVPLRLLVMSGRPSFTRSEAEERFLALMGRAGLPAPEVNVGVAGHEVDFLWRRARLVVEVDGYDFHAYRGAFERDRARDAQLVAAGFAVIRVTWKQLTEAPEEVVARTAQALGSGAVPDARRRHG